MHGNRVHLSKCSSVIFQNSLSTSEKRNKIPATNYIFFQIASYTQCTQIRYSCMATFTRLFAYFTFRMQRQKKTFQFRTESKLAILYSIYLFCLSLANHLPSSSRGVGVAEKRVRVCVWKRKCTYAHQSTLSIWGYEEQSRTLTAKVSLIRVMIAYEIRYG